MAQLQLCETSGCVVETPSETSHTLSVNLLPVASAGEQRAEMSDDASSDMCLQLSGRHIETK